MVICLDLYKHDCLNSSYLFHSDGLISLHDIAEVGLFISKLGTPSTLYKLCPQPHPFSSDL